MGTKLGEAKHRKLNDPYFGKYPKHGKGLIISNPMEIDGNRVTVKQSMLDSIELRRSVLFWDKILWPSNNGIYIAGSPDTDFLEDCGILERPKYQVNGDLALGMTESYLRCFFENEREDPGNWAVSNGDNSLLLRSKEFSKGRGESVELFRAIPIPEADVPLEEVLRFKEKRLDEVRALQIVINEFYSDWTGAEDKYHQLNLSISKIENACIDITKVAKENQNRFRMSNWKVGIGLNVVGIAGAAEIGKHIGRKFGMEHLGQVVGGAISTITLATDIGFSRRQTHNHPFRFAASLETEVI